MTLAFQKRRVLARRTNQAALICHHLLKRGSQDENLTISRSLRLPTANFPSVLRDFHITRIPLRHETRPPPCSRSIRRAADSSLSAMHGVAAVDPTRLRLHCLPGGDGRALGALVLARVVLHGRSTGFAIPHDHEADDHAEPVQIILSRLPS